MPTVSIPSAILDVLQKSNVFEPLRGLEHRDLVVCDTGLAPTLLHLLQSTLQNRSSSPKTNARIVVVVPSQSDANDLYNALKSFDPTQRCVVVPPWETLPFERVSPHILAVGKRIEALWNLAHGATDGEYVGIFIFSARSFAQRFHLGLFDYVPLTLNAGDELDLDAVVGVLRQFGYDRVYQVEAAGEFAIRGSIIDIFPANRDTPIRIDLFGDEIEVVKEFSLGDHDTIT